MAKIEKALSKAEQRKLEERQKQAEEKAKVEKDAEKKLQGENEALNSTITDPGAPNSVTELEKATGAKLEEVPYEKISATGQTKEIYLPTSGETVDVYSKWPHALRYETKHGVCVIEGLSKLKLIGSPFMVTTIPVEQWNDVARVYGKTKLFKNHFVFVAKNKDYGDSHAEELANEKTGAERLEQGKIGIGIEKYQE